MSHTIGSTIAERYQVRQVLGGSMGEIYACHDPVNDQLVAIKTFRPEYVTNPTFLVRFNDEAALWLELGRHENIVQCLSVETWNSMPYLILELIRGEPTRGHNLRNWLRNGALPVCPTA